MKLNVYFLEPAENELVEAVNYYNMQSYGLGFEFAIEVQKAIERIIQYPNSWSKLSTRTRKCRCNRFPYNVIYSLKDETIIIIAIMHTKRKPNYWEKRNIN
ncbi:MAG TPA: type II toxin-antitoxin system RelE/ParE family toxin [Candidatus Kapabacteria bacterium]|nr:type II toxin-antitoxin system RelE/ParE family toxin [Candidatus Kapabacteria bacterium]HPO61592.1 type II toxin-antitoxin system RelE/ParE family toxin [Candidatus Kapabacteria bacterium]